MMPCTKIISSCDLVDRYLKEYLDRVLTPQSLSTMPKYIWYCIWVNCRFEFALRLIM